MENQYTKETGITMNKIIMINPIVEMNGDEMTRIIWSLIKENLILPFIDLKTEYYDLGLNHRNDTNDEVTVECANAIKKYKIGVKCATITPNAQRMTEYNLKSMWKSPNGTIREILDGTVFREPIIVKNIIPTVSCWKKPIIIARHAYGDVYSAREFRVKYPGYLNVEYLQENGEKQKIQGFDFDSEGIIQILHNKDTSITSFARSCFNFALDRKMDLWFSTKDTISKKYDQLRVLSL